MPLASPGSLLFLAAALLWLPATRRWSLLPLAAAYAWACLLYTSDAADE